MGQIVFAGAMSHVLDPDYYQAACGDVGRQKVTAAMAAIEAMGERFAALAADALIVVADDHLNAFSFNCVPAICVRIGKTVQRMMQDAAEAFDKVLEHLPREYPLHEALAGQVLEQGLQNGFDLAAIAGADLTDVERAAFIAGDMRRINELGGYLHLVMSIPKIGTHGGH